MAENQVFLPSVNIPELRLNVMGEAENKIPLPYNAA